LLLLEPQCDLLLFAIDLKDLDFDLLVDGNHFRWVTDPFPTHIGDVKQTIDATQVDERTEVGDVLDDTFADLADFQFCHEVFAIFFALLLNQRSSADDDIASRFVDLENFALNNATDVIADVVGTTNVDLACRQEDIDTDIDEQSTLDLASDRTGDDLSFLDRSHHVFPLDDLLSFALAEADHVPGFFEIVLVFHFLDQDLDGLTDFRWWFTFFPFVLGNSTFALESDVDYDELFVDFNDLAFDDLVDVELFIGVLEGIEQQFFCGIAEHLIEFGFDTIVFEGANEGTIDHAEKILGLVRRRERSPIGRQPKGLMPMACFSERVESVPVERGVRAWGRAAQGASVPAGESRRSAALCLRWCPTNR